jgi:hypothetical protein
LNTLTPAPYKKKEKEKKEHTKKTGAVFAIYLCVDDTFGLLRDAAVLAEETLFLQNAAGARGMRGDGDGE